MRYRANCLFFSALCHDFWVQPENARKIFVPAHNLSHKFYFQMESLRVDHQWSSAPGWWIIWMPGSQRRRTILQIWSHTGMHIWLKHTILTFFLFLEIPQCRGRQKIVGKKIVQFWWSVWNILLHRKISIGCREDIQ